FHPFAERDLCRRGQCAGEVVAEQLIELAFRIGTTCPVPLHHLAADTNTGDPAPIRTLEYGPTLRHVATPVTGSQLRVTRVSSTSPLEVRTAPQRFLRP